MERDLRGFHKLFNGFNRQLSGFQSGESFDILAMGLNSSPDPIA
jgi:hypothetical protein